MKSVEIIGMGLSPEDLTVRHLKMIDSADILVGGQRLLDYFPACAARKHPIGKNIAETIEFIKDRMQLEHIVVLASGDPLFFGIGSILTNALGPDQVRIHPNISSVAAAFGRIKRSWSNARVVSLHGRKDETMLFQALNEADTVAVFTDPVKNPAWIAAQLIAKGRTDYKLCVLESLGADTERVDWYDPEQALEMNFAEPNLVILDKNKVAQALERTPHLGIPDHDFVHQKGLITKSEIRAITLAKLRLMPDHVVWDLGAGSGSVSIEAALLARRGSVIAVEKNPDRVHQIEANLRRFGLTNLQVVRAVLPDGLEGLPRPDRIFIGGGGKHLKSIIESAASRLKQDGLMVINTVLMASLLTALDTLEALAFEANMVQVQISHSHKMPWSVRLEAHNPVWIITGIRKSDPSSSDRAGLCRG